MRLIAFAARCQRVDIREQYLKYGVRCFDLRVRTDEDGRLVVAHGPVIYTLTIYKVCLDLDLLNGKGDCYVRVLHEARTKSQYTEKSVKWFGYFCHAIEEKYPGITFIPSMMAGGTDSRYYCDLSPTRSVYRFTGIFESGRSGGAHSVNEHIDTEILCDNVEFYVNLFSKYGK